MAFDRARELFIIYADRKPPDTGNDRPHRNPLSCAGRAHRGPKRLALPEHRDAEWARDKIQSALKDG